MAIYHANLKNFSRGKGESATAAAAYRAGIDILDTRTRIAHNYARRSGVISYHMLAPAGAPVWCNDPAVFFDACEHRESRANAIVGRELEVSLPAELGVSQRRDLALSLGQILVDRYQVVVLAALHAPAEKGDQRNFHVHLLMSSRRVGVNGFGSRAGSEFDARGGRGADEIREVRALVGGVINQALSDAGIRETVDHRSLRAQAMAAHAAGNFDKAAALSRPPTRHIGKAITAALRRSTLDPLLTKAGITSTPVQTPMQEAEAIFARQGRLMAASGDSRKDVQSLSTAQRVMQDAEASFARQGRLATPPEAHGPQAARDERAREQVKIGNAVNKVSPGPVRSSGLPSPLALRLSRLARITRAQGTDAEVLNEQARLIEEWLAVQQEIAKTAFESLHSIAGIQVESVVKRAMETAARRRDGIYSNKPFFFEDSEVLTGAISDYARAVVHPERMRDAVRRAQAQLSQVEVDGSSKSYALWNSAQRGLAKARAGVSKSAQIASDRRISEARAVMVAATEAIERDYYITPLDRVETSPPHPYTAGPGGGERKSDSNRVQLKPRSGPVH